MIEKDILHVCKELADRKISFKENEITAQYSSFKVGGSARLAIFPENIEELTAALGFLAQRDIKREVVGNASNLLFAFSHFDGAIVFTSKLSCVRFDGKIVDAQCGASLTRLALMASEKGLSGLEFAYGIPALVGGAVYMNAGAYGSSVSDVLLESKAFDCEKNEIIVLKAEDHAFDYRKSVYMKNSSLVCLGASFGLHRGDESEIKAKMNENMRSRREKQPLEFPSAGSYFKRPEGHFAGKLIEDCGLKGERVGGAEVSEKHAGFIINRGGATADDILALEEKIKERVKMTFGVELQREVRVIK